MVRGGERERSTGREVARERRGGGESEGNGGGREGGSEAEGGLPDLETLAMTSSWDAMRQGWL